MATFLIWKNIHINAKENVKNLIMNKTITTQKHPEKGLHFLATLIVQRYFSSSEVKFKCTGSLLTHAKMRCVFRGG